jgi:hypothetical protein
MRAAPSTLALAALLSLGPACGHAPPSPARSEAAPVWPAAPAVPRLRLLAELQVGAVARPPTSWWRGALDWLAGVEGEPGDEGLARPFDVAFAADGSMLVADPDGPRVVRFAASGRFLAELTCAGRPWGAPVSVATDGDAVYVSDPGAAAVVRWSAAGCRELGAGALERPSGLAVSAEHLLVTDPPAHQVVVLRRDGTVAARWGERGAGDGQLHFPTDVAVGADGTAWVVDAFNFRVAHLASDGRWLGAFGAPGEEAGGFLRPKGIAAGPGGDLYVTDAQRDLVLVYGSDGAFQLAVGSPGAAPGQLSHPAGLAATRDRLAVADSLNRRIQIFEVLGERP